MLLIVAYASDVDISIYDFVYRLNIKTANLIFVFILQNNKSPRSFADLTVTVLLFSDCINSFDYDVHHPHRGIGVSS